MIEGLGHVIVNERSRVGIAHAVANVNANIATGVETRSVTMRRSAIARSQKEAREKGVSESEREATVSAVTGSAAIVRGNTGRAEAADTELRRPLQMTVA